MKQAKKITGFSINRPSPAWDLLGFVACSSYRVAVLNRIELPRTPTQLAKTSNIDIAHVSRSLTEFVERKLAILLTGKTKKGKLFVRTQLGAEISEQIEKIEKRDGMVVVKSQNKK